MNTNTPAGKKKTFLSNYSTALTMAVFAVVGVTGVLIFFHLGDRYFKAAHEWLGMAFVLAVVLHLARHWKPFTHLLKQKRTWVLSGVSGLALALFVGAAATGQGGGGNPMMRMAISASKVPIEALAPGMGLSSAEVLARLQQAGIQVADASVSLDAIAAEQGMPLPRLYGAILDSGQR